MVVHVPKAIEDAATRYGLFGRGDHLLVAVSGGADSVALLTALAGLAPRLALGLTVAHLDHRIRGGAAEADAAFVSALCKCLGVPCVTGRADVPRRARRRGISLEMAAREARYDFLIKTARRAGAQAIVTAHTADDVAETVLLKLARGAGARGLSGVPRRTVRGGVPVVRPMLAVPRREIERFLRAANQAWREDATNRDVSFLRNRVRHEIMPLLEARLNPRLGESLCRAADVLAEEDAWLDMYAERLLARCAPGQGDALAAGLLTAEPLAIRRRLLRRWLAGRGVPESAVDYQAVDRIEQLAQRPKGTGTVALADGWAVRRRYDTLALGRDDARPDAGAFRVTLNVPGETLLPVAGCRVTVAVAPGIVRPRDTRAGRLPACASLALAPLKRRRLVARSWRAGDRMAPFGLAGSKKLQDIFTDAKLPCEARHRVPVIACGHEIVWLPGYRVARAWAVPDPSTPAIQLTLDPY